MESQMELIESCLHDMKSTHGKQFLERSIDGGNGDSGKYVPLSTSTITESSSTKLGSRTSKRARTNLQSRVPVCQVHGCNKDLSSSKDYHKRHRVCDIHSKTSVVVVRAIQQRFCQQCSRFHMLSEFDGDKRSCRKRLANHNQRRRKPQYHCHFGKLRLKSEMEHAQMSQLAVPLQLNFSLQKSLLHLNGIVKQHPSNNHPMAQPFFVQNMSPGSISGTALYLLSSLNT